MGAISATMPPASALIASRNAADKVDLPAPGGPAIPSRYRPRAARSSTRRANQLTGRCTNSPAIAATLPPWGVSWLTRELARTIAPHGGLSPRAT
ncbi:hypothetical protein IU450_31535 [Nocardia abscessus]|uniref:hypothetical protein n=1 Tax=Nocardia abscessus TaxID=120957 RepID=UPI0018937EC5|nr:hypothetical protein [Nocardia abscessus]MBF6340392.1 hypothetical protein [Nocardia abscessus]